MGRTLSSHPCGLLLNHRPGVRSRSSLLSSSSLLQYLFLEIFLLKYLLYKCKLSKYKFGFLRKNHPLKVQLLNSNNSIFIYIFHILKFSLYEKSFPKKTDQSINNRSKEGGRDGSGGKLTQFTPFFST